MEKIQFDYVCIYLAAVLKHKTKSGIVSKTPLPEPPRNKNGKILFGAWAKVLRESQHPWYNIALDQLSKQ